MGARIRIDNERTEDSEPLADIVVESSRLKGVELGGEIIPWVTDEIPVLAVAGCFAEGKTVIKDASELRIKESDRVTTVVSELSRLGARIEPLPDGMGVYGGKPLSGTMVDSHSDRRLAMSLAIAGLMARGQTVITHARAACVSHPAFWETLRQLMH